MNKIGDHNAIYTDGGYTPTSSGKDRYLRGYQDGIAILNAIKSGDIKVKKDANGKIIETIKIVGHSHGGWHAAGMADAINEMAEKMGFDKNMIEVLFD